MDVNNTSNNINFQGKLCKRGLMQLDGEKFNKVANIYQSLSKNPLNLNISTYVKVEQTGIGSKLKVVKNLIFKLDYSKKEIIAVFDSFKRWFDIFPAEYIAKEFIKIDKILSIGNIFADASKVKIANQVKDLSKKADSLTTRSKSYRENNHVKEANAYEYAAKRILGKIDTIIKNNVIIPSKEDVVMPNDMNFIFFEH